MASAIELVLRLNSTEAKANLSSVKTQINQLSGQKINPIDSAGIQKAGSDLAGAFASGKSSANELLDRQRQIVAAMAMAGQTGTKEFKAAQSELVNAKKSADEFEKAMQKAMSPPKSNLGEAMFRMNQAFEATQRVAGALGGVIDYGEAFTKNLKAVGAFTGTSGKELENLSDKARSLGKRFADIGEAKDQLEIFSNVLSKLGPEYGKNSEAMEVFARNVNVLAKAGGMDLKQSADSMTGAMLQFGLASGDASKDAETSTRVINMLAQSARSGAAQIPQASESLLQVGATARGVGISMQETLAAVQTLSKSGKTGAEAGVALRNVISLIQRPAGEGAVALQRMGISSRELAVALKEGGLYGALSMLKTGMGSINDDVERGAVLQQLFGLENKTAAANLIDNLGKYKQFQNEIVAGTEGIGTATEMFNQKSGSVSGILAKWKAQISDTFISANNALGALPAAALKATTSILPSLGSLAMIAPALSGMGGKTMDMFKTIGAGASSFARNLISQVVPSVATTGAASAAAGAAGASGFGAMAAAVWAATWPILAVAGALAAVGVGVYALMGGFKDSAEDIKKNNDAELALIETKKKSNSEAQANEKNKLEELRTYESLIEKKNRTAEEDAKLYDLQLKFKDSYPAVVQLGEDHASSLDKIKTAMGLNGVELSKLTDENRQLIGEYEELGKKEASLKNGMSLSTAEQKKKAEIMQKLNGVYPGAIDGTKSFSDNLKNLKTVAGLSNNAIQALVTQMQDLDKQSQEIALKGLALQRSVLDEQMSKELTGAWMGDPTGLNNFKKAMYSSQNREQATKALNDYLNNIYNNPQLSAEQKQKGVKLAQDFANAQSTYLDALKNGAQKPKAEIAVDAKVDKRGFAELENEIKNIATQIQNGELAGKALTTATKAMQKEITGSAAMGEITANQSKRLQAELAELTKKSKSGSISNAEKKDLEYANNLLARIRELEDLKKELSAKSIDDANKRELEELKAKHAKELSAYDEQIGKIAEKQKAKNVSAASKKALDEEIKIIKEISKAKQGIQETEIVKYYEKIATEENKKADEILKRNAESNKARLEFLKAQQGYLNESDLTANLAEQEFLSLQIIKEGANLKVDALLKADEKYKKAQESIFRAQAKLDTAWQAGDETAIESAISALDLAQTKFEDVKNSIIAGDKQIILANKKAEEETTKTKIEAEKSRKIALASFIDSEAEKERTIKTAEAEANYKEELALAAGNASKILVAERKLSDAKIAINQDYINKARPIYSAFADSIKTFGASIKFDFSDGSGEEIKKTREEINSLKKDYALGKIQANEYYAQLDVLGAQLREKENKRAKAFINGIAGGLEAAATELKTKSEKLFADAAENYAKTAEAGQDTSKALSDMVGAATVTMGAAGAQALVSGKNVFKAMAAQGFDFLQSMVPVWTAQITGYSLSSIESVTTWGAAGLAKAAAITTLLTVAIQGAKAAATGFFHGGYTGKGNPYDIAGVVHYDEVVVNSRGSSVGKNKELALMMNKGVDVGGMLADALSLSLNVQLHTRNLEKAIINQGEQMAQGFESLRKEFIKAGYERSRKSEITLNNKLEFDSNAYIKQAERSKRKRLSR